MNATKNISPYIFLALVAAISIVLKLHVYGVGAPYVTIDDNTLFNAGFLVWFGEAPPQRMYLESWVVGITSIATYIFKLLAAGNIDQLGLNIVADAYRDFSNAPEQYVLNYRGVMLATDIATALILFFFAKHIFSQRENQNWLAAFSSALFLLSYNTLWCYIVARPDTLTSFFAMLGILFYYKSNFGNHKNYLLLCALSLGCATGLKLHAALFVVLFCLDMLREHGIIKALKQTILFAFISLFTFLAVAGSPLFDPLLYVKLRMLNIKDDESPWIQWGDQIITQFEGTGWLISPLVLAGSLYIFFQNKINLDSKIKSLLLISSLLILFFLSVRQLRAYWMLPALPLIYVSGVYLLSLINSTYIKYSAAIVILGIFLVQIFHQSKEFDNSKYTELQDWVQKNATANDVIYIVGFDTLFLPCNTTCLQNRKASLERNISNAQESSENFTTRHVRLWEERASLKFIDMLESQSDTGFNYYSLNGAPLEMLSPDVTYEDITIVLAMQGYKSAEADPLIANVERDFTKVTVANAPGGKAGTGGLPYDIYVRNNQ